MATPIVAPLRPTRVGRSEPPRLAFRPVCTRVLQSLLGEARAPAKVLSIVAPTGYGKTVLGIALLDEYRGSGTHCLWAGLDDRDTSLERVLSLLESVVGLHAMDRVPGTAMLQGDEPVDDRIDALVQFLSRGEEPTAIFLDNVGFCSDESLRKLLDALVFGTPPSLHLVFASTRALPMNTARAKLEGRSREIGYADLSFNTQEIAALLGMDLCNRLEPAAVDTILRQTEGWPAAVRLMQIILSSDPDPMEALHRFSGTDEDIADLLNRQVLDSFDGRLRSFLLEISHLRSFCVDLCRHVTGDEAASAHLASLLKQNVFVIPLDRNRSWYRLHGLFREFLVGEAKSALTEGCRRDLLVRAAEWSEREGQWQEAIEYALTAGAMELASTILDRFAAVCVRDRGDLRQFIEWVERLAAARVRVGWQADYWYVWALVFHRRYEAARHQLERLDQRLQQETDHCPGGMPRRELQRALDVIRVTIDTFTDHLPAAYGGAERWLAGADGDDPFNIATVACAAAIHLGSSLDFTRAREMMQIARTAIAQAQSDYGSAWVSLLNAMIMMGEGDYAAAAPDIRATLARARTQMGDHSGVVSTIALVAAKCEVELGREAEGRELLRLGMRRVQTHGLIETAAMGLHAAVVLWKGEADDPVSLAELRDVASGFPPRLGLMLSSYLVRRFLRLGRLDDAEAESARISLLREKKSQRPEILWALANPRAREMVSLALIELMVAKGKLRQAEALITKETALARERNRVGILIELALAAAAASVAAGQPTVAARHLVRAIGHAAKRGATRPFRERATLIAGLVNETKARDWGFAVEEERRFFAELCSTLPMSNVGLLDQFAELNIQPTLVEAPTARERELLDLMEAGLSNQQLADRLSVSVATVKWHLYNLYAKLGASNRSAALARARALNLLSS